MNAQVKAIRKEIERRLKYTHDWLRGDEKRHPKQTAVSTNYYKMKGDERTLDALLNFIASLPDEPATEEVHLEEEVVKYFEGLWPGMETAEQCNNNMSFTPPAIMRLVEHFYSLGKQSK